MSKKFSKNRRKFLSYSSSTAIVGLAQTPAAALFSLVLGGESQRAWAQSLGINPRIYVDLMEGGGPCTVESDTLLTPYSTANYVQNPWVATRFENVGGRYTRGVYDTVEYHGMQVPYMWSLNLPTPNGGSRPMHELLSNMLFMQGITTHTDGHDICQERHWVPAGASISSVAMGGDPSSSPFSGINMNASRYNYLSRKSKTGHMLNNTSGNALDRLLGPFEPDGTQAFRDKMEGVDAAFSALLPALDDLARKGHVGAQALSENRTGALSLLSTNFENLDGIWTNLRAKYEDLVQRAIYDPGNPLPGINDRPIGEPLARSNTGLYQVNNNLDAELHLSADLRNNVDSRTTVFGLAERFAVAEYAILNNLSRSIAIGIGGIGPLIRVRDNATVNGMGNDKHDTGFFPHFYFSVLRSRAVYACVAELIRVLQQNDLFEDTLISRSGEFRRNVRTDGTGSDHGWRGKGRTFWCGAFNGPLSVGNLIEDNRMCWGAGGGIPELGGNQLDLARVMVTMAEFLRVPRPFTAFNPVVTLGSNGLVSNIGRTVTVPRV